MNKKASVVIPTYNKVHRLELVLESFKYQSESTENFEVLIIDDGSSDGTENLIKSINVCYNLIYIRQDNHGRSHARNTGIDKANHPIIIFCDDDCIVSKEFVKSHINAHSKRESSVVHGRIYNLPYLKFFKHPSRGELYEDLTDSEKISLEFLKKNLIELEDVKDFKKIDSQKKLTFFEKQIKNIFEGNYLDLRWLGFTGGNVSCPAALLKQAGRFDEQLDQKWGCEDLEFGYRLYKSGIDFSYCDEASNYHIAHFRKTFSEELKFSINKFYAKHEDNFVLNLPPFLLGEVKSVEEYIKLCK